MSTTAAPAEARRLSAYAAEVIPDILRASDTLLYEVVENGAGECTIQSTAAVLLDANRQLELHAKEAAHGIDDLAYNTAAAAAFAAHELVDASVRVGNPRRTDLVVAAYELVGFLKMLIAELPTEEAQ